ncbi:MAG: Smr/MutS family protein [Desulfobacterales bacterium]
MAKARFQRSVRSFKDLDRLIPHAELSPSAKPCPPPAEEVKPKCEVWSGGETPVKLQTEQELFQHAMRDVVPLRQNRTARIALPPCVPQRLASLEENEGAQALTALVREGKNFIVEFTSEYIEGRGYRVPPEITRQLHQGRFAVQDHLDLHGHSAASAQAQLHSFFKEALRSGKNTLLIVHGRGHGSAGKPVLKAMVQNWLRRGPFRKHMVAYTSARPCDGGTGATYVLLRRRPLTKRCGKRGVCLSFN